MVSSANIFVIPLITKFALCIILTGFIVLFKINGLNEKLQFSIFLSAILVYTRPEFFLTLVLTVVIYLIYVFKNYESKESKNIVKEILPVLLITFFLIFFNPVSKHRANIAFAQHYSMDIQEREQYRFQNPVKILKPEEIMKEDFSTDYSITEALINNPKLFFEHIGFNIFRINEHIKDIFPFFLLNNGFQFLLTFLNFISLILLIFLIYFLIVRISKKNFNLPGIAFSLYVIPPVISVFIFYPRVHYMIFIFAFILIYLSYEASIRFDSYKIVRKYNFPAAIFAGILMVIVIPFRARSESIHNSKCTALKTVFAIKSLEFRKEINFLSIDPIISTYIEKDWNCINGVLLESPVDDFIQRKNINLILADEVFINHPVIKKDKLMNKIINDTNFVRMNIPGCNSYLIAKKDILDN